jgi:eukaryotic-like serine/threonine-protein kinase
LERCLNLKINCWQYKKCGRQIGGENAKNLGVCPAAIEKRVDGINGGEYGGRCCWAVEGGILCDGQSEDLFALKLIGCIQCNFFTLVKKEEGDALRKASEIISLLDQMECSSY